MPIPKHLQEEAEIYAVATRTNANGEQEAVTNGEAVDEVRKMLGLGSDTKVEMIGPGGHEATISAGPGGMSLSPLRRCGRGGDPRTACGGGDPRTSGTGDGRY